MRAGGGLDQGRGSWDAEEGHRSELFWGKSTGLWECLAVMIEGGAMMAGDLELPDLADRVNDSADIETAEDNGQ